MLSSQRKLQFSDLGAINQNLMVNSTTQNPTKIMNGAMDAMVHLQSTYNLDTSEMARGIIKTNTQQKCNEQKAQTEMKALATLTSPKTLLQ